MSYEQPRRDDGKHLETGSESRQASYGRPVLYVLVGGLILAAIFLIGTQIWNAAEDDPPPGQLIEGEGNPDGAVAPAVPQPEVEPAPAG